MINVYRHKMTTTVSNLVLSGPASVEALRAVAFEAEDYRKHARARTPPAPTGAVGGISAAGATSAP